MCAGDIIKPPSYIANFEPWIDIESKLRSEENGCPLDQISFLQTKNIKANTNTDNQLLYCIEPKFHPDFPSCEVNIKKTYSDLKSKGKEQSLYSKNSYRSILNKKKRFLRESCYCYICNTLFCNHVMHQNFNSNYKELSLSKLSNVRIAHMLSLINQKDRETFRRISSKKTNHKLLKKYTKTRKTHKLIKQTNLFNNCTYSNENTENECNNNSSGKSTTTNYGMFYNCFTSMEGQNKCERHLTSTLKRFRKSRKGIKERFKKHDTDLNPIDSDHSNGDRDSNPKNKGHGFSFSRNRSLSTRRNSSPNLFCKNISKPPILSSSPSKKNIQGAIPKTYLSSEEQLNKKCSESENQQTSSRSSQNTIKLIDKFLDASSARERNSRTPTLEKLRDRKCRRSLSMEENLPLSIFKSDIANHVKFDSSSEITGYCNSSLARSVESRVDEDYNQDKSKKMFSDTKSKRDKSDLYLNIKKDDGRASSLENSEPSSVIFLEPSCNLKANFNDELFESISKRKIEGVTTSFESMNLKPPKSVLGRESRQTSDLLLRLDSVLSELVEEEKLKIQKFEMFKLSRNKNYFKLQSPKKRKTVTKSQNCNKNEHGGPKSYLTPPDIIQRYKEKFTEGKPHNPRILKNRAKSKLESMTCYQRPRTKQSMKISKTDISDVKGYNKESYTSPASDSDSRDGQEDNYNKASFEDEWSNFSSASVASEKYVSNGKASQLEDEDDTCYGSDHIGSDVVLEPDESMLKIYFPSKHASKMAGDLSIDSAYTESREATPDFNISSQFMETDYGEKEKVLSYVADEERIEIQRSPVQMINDAKRYLLDKIKESRSYSDNHINKILNYYSRKWSHIPEREMKIIVRSIRSDLGVRAPPKECIELLEENFNLNTKGSSCQNLTDNNDISLPLRKELSKEDILADLTATLPEYLKAYQDTRKAMSLSPSPELLGYTLGKDVTQSFFKVPPRSSSREENIERIKSSSPSFSDPKFILPPIEIIDMDPPEESDEEWVKKTVGEETYREMEVIINELKEKENISDADPSDFERMASELCERFSISF